MTTAIHFEFTTAGLAAINNASNTGLELDLTHIAVGDAQRTFDPSFTSLGNEKERMAISSGVKISDTQDRFSSLLPETYPGPSYYIGEIALIGNGIVVAIATRTGSPYTHRIASESLYVPVDMTWAAIPAGSINVVVEPLSVALQGYVNDKMTAHLVAADPHPQYTTDSEVRALIEARVGDYVVATGSANAYVVGLNPAITSYTGDISFRVKLNITNTGAATLNAGGGAVPWVRNDGAAFVAGDLAAGAVWQVNYDSAAGKFYALSEVDSQVKALISAAITTQNAMPRYTTGQALPASNIGPIWHDDYNSIMTWQSFAANGANYIGYASLLVGSLLADTQPTPRPGYFSSGATNLSRTTYAAVRGWAIHNGIMVAAGTWAAGNIAVCDNPDGTTFKTYDVRAEFPRFWDNSRGVDAGRLFGAAQAATTLDNRMTYTSVSGNQGEISPLITNPDSVVVTGSLPYQISTAFSTSQTGVRSSFRPRNVPLNACIKF